MAHRITQVDEDSIAARHGIKAGDSLISINGETIIDQIDYQALSTGSHLTLELAAPDGRIRHVSLRKDEYDPLGLSFDDSMLGEPRSCCNHCVFCFIDQMPSGMRETLYVKDDDWRFSLMMGNYMTLTNMSDQELDRLIKRHASPLYISVQATDGEARKKIMRNPTADKLMARLNKLKDGGIHFHCQIVSCPGWNDGAVLDQTLRDLAALYPAAQSAAIVPVGLTKYRDNLVKLTPYNKETALQLLEQVKPFQAEYREKLGTSFVFPSDEFYCLSGAPLPDDAYYERYPQIENGVGLLRQFINEVELAAEDLTDKPKRGRRLHIACGTSVAPHLRALCERFAPKDAEITVKPVLNDFWGHTITVTGLLAGQDFIHQLKDVQADEILICDCTLRHDGDRFLDDITPAQVRATLASPVRFIPNEGEAFYRAICGMEDE